MNEQKPKKLACTKCTVGVLRRLSRVTFMERHVLYALGIFPWECVLCREKSYCRNDGHAEILKNTEQNTEHKVATGKSAA